MFTGETHTHLTLSLWIKVNKSQFLREEVIFESEVSVTKNLITRMNKKMRSTKSEKWRHTCNLVEIAWTNEQKVAVTSYGRNKNHDDEIKKHSRTSPDVQFKEFSLTKQKTRPRTDYEWIGKTI